MVPFIHCADFIEVGRIQGTPSTNLESVRLICLTSILTIVERPSAQSSSLSESSSMLNLSGQSLNQAEVNAFL